MPIMVRNADGTYSRVAAVYAGENAVNTVCAGSDVVFSAATPTPQDLPVKTGLVGIFEYGNFENGVWSNSVSGKSDFSDGAMYADNGCYIHPEYGYGARYQVSGGDLTGECTYYIVGCAKDEPPEYSRDKAVFLSSWWYGGMMIFCGNTREGYPKRFIAMAYDYTNTAVDTGVAWNTPAVYAVTCKSGTMKVYVNGTLVGTSAVGVIHNDFVDIGSTTVSETPGLGSRYKFIGIGTVEHTAAEIAENSAWLAQKYGIGV